MQFQVYLCAALTACHTHMYSDSDAPLALASLVCHNHSRVVCAMLHTASWLDIGYEHMQAVTHAFE
jgi:hypothetical protein